MYFGSYFASYFGPHFRPESGVSGPIVDHVAVLLADASPLGIPSHVVEI